MIKLGKVVVETKGTVAPGPLDPDTQQFAIKP